MRDIFDLHRARNVMDGFGNGHRAVKLEESEWESVVQFYDIFSGADIQPVINSTCAIDEDEYNTYNKPTKAEKEARAREEMKKKNRSTRSSRKKDDNDTQKSTQGVPEVTEEDTSGSKDCIPTSTNRSQSSNIRQSPARAIGKKTKSVEQSENDGGPCADETAGESLPLRDDHPAAQQVEQSNVNQDEEIEKEMEEAMAARAHERAKTILLDDGLDIDSDEGKDSSSTAARAPPSGSLIIPNTRRAGDEEEE